jgi:hypothetical protein
MGIAADGEFGHSWIDRLVAFPMGIAIQIPPKASRKTFVD